MTGAASADFDAIIVGGGPAGSTCARFLVRGGARVAVVDRAQFPRVKLCGGWLSRAIWDELEIPPRDYPGQLWEWNTCHVSYRGQERAIPCHGWFIRRYELDDFLLRASGAELHLGVEARDVTRDAEGYWSVAGLRARHLIGAGGTHCPVARLLAPPRPTGPVGAQEHEFRADPDAIARTRAGRDGEPELLLHDHLRGSSWNVPKTEWLNVGSGTVDPGEVRAAWRRARTHFVARAHIPQRSSADLEPAAMKGHAYFLYHPAHVGGAARVNPDRGGGAYLVGDSLGLAHPLTAEGILPAVISGRLAAQAILAGTSGDYPARLAAHPVFADYRRVARVIAARRGRRDPASDRAPSISPAEPQAHSWPARLGQRALMNGFAWMFSGARLPAPKIIDVGLDGMERWLARGAGREAPS
ncbi:MAG TPA: NAD(P)/FAD-dependent oxidoreductase [Polyangia bacterium]|nr:NAD(P)/FAD-dependent oxidoreductase [Polyangia bacterium]